MQVPRIGSGHDGDSQTVQSGITRIGRDTFPPVLYPVWINIKPDNLGEIGNRNKVRWLGSQIWPIGVARKHKRFGRSVVRREAGQPSGGSESRQRRRS